jgi:hypothetical protein
MIFSDVGTPWHPALRLECISLWSCGAFFVGLPPRLLGFPPQVIMNCMYWDPRFPRLISNQQIADAWQRGDKSASISQCTSKCLYTRANYCVKSGRDASDRGRYLRARDCARHIAWWCCTVCRLRARINAWICTPTVCTDSLNCAVQ